MSRIKFTVEDSKVSEILKELLNLGIEITDLEVSTSEYDKDLESVKKYIPDTGYIPPKRKLDDEGFDYTGSTKKPVWLPDNIYQYPSTTDVKSPKWNPKLSISTGCTVENLSPKTLAKPSPELDKTISLKSELDFPYFKEE